MAAGRSRFSARVPNSDDVEEILYAHVVDHSYPLHTHDTWTLLTVDRGVVRYDLDRHEHAAERSQVILLPPGVPHNGSTVRAEGFSKRVLYLRPHLLDMHRIGQAVDRPLIADPVLLPMVDHLFTSLSERDEAAAAEFWLRTVVDRLDRHLAPHRSAEARCGTDTGVAQRFRNLLDERFPGTLSLDDAARILERHPVHLARAFVRAFGIPPHQYVNGRRIELARHLLLNGSPISRAATLSGFYDQSHLSRHFRRMMGVSPGRYARATRPGAALPAQADARDSTRRTNRAIPSATSERSNRA